MELLVFLSIMNEIFRSWGPLTGLSNQTAGALALTDSRRHRFNGQTLPESISELDASDLEDLQMFLALRKRQRRALIASESVQVAAAVVLPSAFRLVTIPEETTCADSASHRQLGGPAVEQPSSTASIRQHLSSPSSDFTLPKGSVPHTSTGKKLFQCRVCPLVLSSSSNRARHERMQHPAAHAKGFITSGRKRSAAAAELPDVEDTSPTVAAAPEEPKGDSECSQRVSHKVESDAQFPLLNPSSPLVPTAVAADAQMEGIELESQEGQDLDLLMLSSEGVAMSSELEQNSVEIQQVPNAFKFDRDGAVNEQEEVKLRADLTRMAGVTAVLDAKATERDQMLQEACAPFLQWLCQPPMTEVEALVKARRVKDISQLKPIKLNLRFIFGLLVESQTVDTLQLTQLSQRPVCEMLARALDQRNVGSTRVYGIFLLVKKVLVFLASQESARRGQFVTPNTYASYMFVDAVCTESTQRRKQDARNRALLGAQSSKALQRTHQFKAGGVSTIWTMPSEAFRMPSMNGLPERLAPQSTLAASADVAADVEPISSGPQVATSPLECAASSAPDQNQSQGESTTSGPESTCNVPPHQGAPSKTHTAVPIEDASANELTTEQLSIIAKGSLLYLQSRELPFYIHHLVTATLCYGLAPRSQVLRALQLGTSFVKQADGLYWVRMLAEQNKNNKPTAFPLPHELTAPYDFYLDTLRPRLLQTSGQQHDYVFFKKNGTAPRADFSELTCTATTQLIGKPKNAHAFRSAVVTAYYTQTGATQSDMNNLAHIVSLLMLTGTLLAV